jgi:hypothetical protein
MQINAIRTIEQLPDNIRKAFIDFVNPLKGFESLWKVEAELETKVESEQEEENEKEGDCKGEGKKIVLPPPNNNTAGSDINSIKWKGFSERTLSLSSNS